MTQIPLTPKQATALKFIKEYWLQHGRAPTYNEISQALDNPSKGNTYRIVDQLIARGHVTRKYGFHRSLQVVPERPIVIDLPPEIETKARAYADLAGVTVEAVIIEALRDRLILAQDIPQRNVSSVISSEFNGVVA